MRVRARAVFRTALQLYAYARGASARRDAVCGRAAWASIAR